MRNKITFHIALSCLLATANVVVAGENPLNQSLMTPENSSSILNEQINTELSNLNLNTNQKNYLSLPTNPHNTPISSGNISPYASKISNLLENTQIESLKKTPTTSGHNSPITRDAIKEEYNKFKVTPIGMPIKDRLLMRVQANWYEVANNGAFYSYDETTQHLCELGLTNNMQSEKKQLSDESISSSQRTEIEKYLENFTKDIEQLNVYLFSNGKTFVVDISSVDINTDLDENKKIDDTNDDTKNITPKSDTNDTVPQTTSTSRAQKLNSNTKKPTPSSVTSYYTGRILGISTLFIALIIIAAYRNNKLDSLMNLFSRYTSRTA